MVMEDLIFGTIIGLGFGILTVIENRNPKY